MLVISGVRSIQKKRLTLLIKVILQTRQPQFWDLENLGFVSFAAGALGRHSCPPMVTGFD
jgi:hypothetical protein